MSKIVKVNYQSASNDGGRNSVGAVPGLDVERIAQMDPALALALVQSPSKQAQTWTIRVQFTSGALDEQVSGTTGGDNGFCCDFLILSMRYQVRRVNSFGGTIFQAQANAAFALNPGIDVTLKVEGQCPNYYLQEDPTPIELVADAPGSTDNASSFPYCLVAPKCGRIKGEFTNRAPFVGGPQGTGPVEVFITFRGISLGCGLQTIELPFAIDELARLGIGSKRVILGDVG